MGVEKLMRPREWTGACTPAKSIIATVTYYVPRTHCKVLSTIILGV